MYVQTLEITFIIAVMFSLISYELSCDLPDVNECETEEHSCNLHKEECVNSIGSYRCKPRPDCPVGFTRDATSLRCVGKNFMQQGKVTEQNFLL